MSSTRDHSLSICAQAFWPARKRSQSPPKRESAVIAVIAPHSTEPVLTDHGAIRDAVEADGVPATKAQRRQKHTRQPAVIGKAAAPDRDPSLSYRSRSRGTQKRRRGSDAHEQSREERPGHITLDTVLVEVLISPARAARTRYQRTRKKPRTYAREYQRIPTSPKIRIINGSNHGRCAASHSNSIRCGRTASRITTLLSRKDLRCVPFKIQLHVPIRFNLSSRCSRSRSQKIAIVTATAPTH